MPKWAVQLIHKHYNDVDAKLIIDAFFNYYTPRFGTISDGVLLNLCDSVMSFELTRIRDGRPNLRRKDA